MKTKKNLFLLCFLLLLTFLYGHSVQAKGTLINDSIYGTSLEGNLLGDPVTRYLQVYLPPGYDLTEKEYPVVYLFHTGGGSERFYPYNEFPPMLEATGLFSQPQDFPDSGFVYMIDSLIISASIKPMIVVMPNINSSYGGSFGVNSALNGNYENYIIDDIIPYIDSCYRTINTRNSRAIAGHCMGGYAATYLAMRHPDVFGVLAGHSTELCIDALARACQPFILAENPEGITGPDPSKPFTSFMFMFSAAFSPNLSNPPYYVDLPLDVDCNIREDILSRWADYDPIQLFSTHITELQSLSGIYYDVGNADELQSYYFLQPFVDALNTAGITHSFELFEGMHFDKLYTRLKKALLFISDSLEHTNDGPTFISGGQVNGAWSSTGSPYLINGHITVSDGETLTIAPGVDVIFKGHYKLNVQGRLLAEGTAADSIKFTADNHSTGWHGIRFMNTPATNDSSIFDYCIFEYGKANTGEDLYNRSGGALLIKYDKVRVSHCLFDNNMCYHDNIELSAGGAIVVLGSPLIEYCEIRNSSGRYGGAMTIYYYGNNPLIRNNYIHHNSGHGTINIGASAEPLLINNIIVHNTTDNHGHIHFANAGGVAVFINNTIANNTCTTGSGGGIFVNHGLEPIFINNIVHGNTPHQVCLESSSGLDFINNLIENGENGFTGQSFTGTYQNNITGNPRFSDPEHGNFSLKDHSPCIAAGVESIDFDGTMYYSPNTDYSCNVRPCPAGSNPDIGALENIRGIPSLIRNINNIDSEFVHCYPNPFHSSITIAYKTHNPGNVTLKIYSITGKEIDTLINNYQLSGEYQVEWKPDKIPAGIYLVHIETHEFSVIRKIAFK